MAKIIGNIVPEDDFTHPLGPEPNFNESMYFNFFDRERSIGGFLRLGNRANEGHAEMTVIVYLPDGRVLFMFKRPEIENNGVFDAGGCRFEVLEPTETLRTVYQVRPSSRSPKMRTWRLRREPEEAHPSESSTRRRALSTAMIHGGEAA
jgi:hypothetical protein